MKRNPIKLNKLPYDAELMNALTELENRIVEDYKKFSTSGSAKNMDEYRKRMFEKFVNSIGYLPGRKYLKIISENCVWGFINLKNENFKEGDILKAANYNAPTLNKPRGNIFNDNYKIAWTGPLYLPGSTGMPSYEMAKGTA